MQNCISVLQIVDRFFLINHVNDFDANFMYEYLEDTMLYDREFDYHRDSFRVFLQSLLDLLRTRKNAYIVTLQTIDARNDVAFDAKSLREIFDNRLLQRRLVLVISDADH